jgi:hypothetical protein
MGAAASLLERRRRLCLALWPAGPTGDGAWLVAGLACCGTTAIAMDPAVAGSDEHGHGATGVSLLAGYDVHLLRVARDDRTAKANASAGAVSPSSSINRYRTRPPLVFVGFVLGWGDLPSDSC